MNVLLIAGTGTIGNELVNILYDKGYNIYITSRKKHQDVDRIHYLCGNPHEFSFMKEILSLYHWDVIIDFMVYSTIEFVSYVDLLLANCLHYVFFSSARVFAQSNKPISEDSTRLLDSSDVDYKYLQTDDYSLLKARQENILNKHVLNNYSIIRPYITYGNDRLQLGIYEHEYWLRRLIKGKCMVLPKDIAEKYTTLTHSHDVANTVFQIIYNNKPNGEVFNVMSSYQIKWNEVANIYLKTLSEVLDIHPNAKYLTNRYLVNSYQAKYDRIYNRIFDNTKIKKFIVTDSFIRPEQGLDKCLRRFLEKPHYRDIPINWIMEGIIDKETGEYENIYKIKGVNNKIKYLVFRFSPKFIQQLFFYFKH